MNVTDEFNRFDTSAKIKSEIKFEVFFEYFMELTDNCFRKYFPEKIESYTDAYYHLKEIVFRNIPEFLPKFYEILKGMGFITNMEVIDSIKLLANNDSLRSLKESIDYLLNSSIINEIRMIDKKIILDTEPGIFEFTRLVDYFENNLIAKKYIQLYDLSNLCHQASWELMEYIDDCNLITSRIPVYFGSECLHTYLQDNKTGNIIDPAHRAMFSLDNYERLFNPTIISKTPKKEAIDEYQEAMKSEDFKDTNFAEPLVIALRKKNV